MLPASVPAPAEAGRAVLAGAGRIVRAEDDRETGRAARKARREALREEKRRLAREERERKAAEKKAEEERQRLAAASLRAAMLDRIRERGKTCGGNVLGKAFAAVPDTRDPRGVRHSLASVLALVLMAMTCGCTTLIAITCWIAAADQELLEAAEARVVPGGTRAAPCGRTVSRILALADPGIVDDCVCRYLADGERALQAAGREEREQREPGSPAGEEPAAEAAEEEEEEPVLMPQVACDGKYVKGARRPDGTTLILLSAATPGGVTLAQREIPSKTNEQPEILPMLRELNEYYPLAGHVLTADALHTHTPLPDLARELGAGCVLTVKDNQPTLRAALENALWAHAAVCVTRDKGHGRRETRSHLVMDAPAEVKALFPPAEQVARVIRTRTVTSWASDGHTRTRETKTSTETVYLVITMTARQASPEHVAVYIRNHWSIENRVHHVRDVTLREDSSQVKAGGRPRVLVSLRNLSTGLIRQSGHREIAATLRGAGRDNDLLLAITRL
jgi:predicted transposase YbfD/YdcC